MYGSACGRCLVVSAECFWWRVKAAFVKEAPGCVRSVGLFKAVVEAHGEKNITVSFVLYGFRIGILGTLNLGMEFRGCWIVDQLQ